MSKAFAIRFPEDVLHAAKQAAKDSGESFTAYVLKSVQRRMEIEQAAADWARDELPALDVEPVATAGEVTTTVQNLRQLIPESTRPEIPECTHSKWSSFNTYCPDCNKRMRPRP